LNSEARGERGEEQNRREAPPLTPYASPLTKKERSITMEELINTIANVGFPIAVAAYLLIRIEGKLCQLTTAITELRQAIMSLQ